MKNQLTTIELGRLLQGPRPSAWAQAEVEKYATGPNPTKPTCKGWKGQICSFFLKRSCKFGIKCRNPHSRGGCIKSQVEQTGKNWKRHICPYFLKGSCIFGVKCRNPHSRGNCMKKVNIQAIVRHV